MISWCKIRFTVLLICLLTLACGGIKDQRHIIIQQNDFVMTLPLGFDSLPVPKDNQFSLARIALGKRLFFDKALSLDSSVSCASCHQTDLYFSDGLSQSVGINSQIVDRNSPSLLNVAYQPRLLREGGVPTLEMQVLVPIQEHKEFNYNIVDLAGRLLADSSYAKQAVYAYNRKLDPYVITRALANYERTLLSGNSPFDQYLYQKKRKAISKEAKAGYSLFISNKTNCIACHSGFNFTNYDIVSTGLYETYGDPGKGRLTNAPQDSGTFKVPSLRNVSMTAPYMHDGSIKTLDQVIDHYASGGKNHKNKSAIITGFTISEQERKQLKAFLISLTDTTVLLHYK